jgi:hypothetical protein
VSRRPASIALLIQPATRKKSNGLPTI